ncbi:MAG: ABC transporter ATP-binding protein [Opitutaceae bacterium]
MSATPHPPVVVRGLSKAYAGRPAVRGVDLEVAAGEIFGLLGPNGAGKTTTVECLVGLRAPDAGEIHLCGMDARNHPGAIRQRLGVALQSTALPDRMTPREALGLFGRFYARQRPVDDLLARFGLTAQGDQAFDRLSGGQRQRLALALAFLNEPAVVFLDEPTTGLDPQARRDLHTLIRGLRDDGCAVVLTTHLLDEAETLCDRVAIIDRGRVVATGRPRDLAAGSRGRQSVTLRARGPLDPERLAGLPGVSGWEPRPDGGRFETEDPAGTLAALAPLLAAPGVELLELQVRRASLEDVFLQLTREEPR